MAAGCVTKAFTCVGHGENCTCSSERIVGAGSCMSNC